MRRITWLTGSTSLPKNLNTEKGFQEPMDWSHRLANSIYDVVYIMNSEKEVSSKDRNFRSLKSDFPTLNSVFRNYPWLFVFLSIIAIIFQFIQTTEIKIGVIAIIVIVEIVLALYLRERLRRQWAERKIDDFISNKSAESVVFHLLEEILKSIIWKGEYTIEKRPKEERYILRKIIGIFCSCNYGWVVDCEDGL
jgi:hypothetical protein